MAQLEVLDGTRTGPPEPIETRRARAVAAWTAEARHRLNADNSHDRRLLADLDAGRLTPGDICRLVVGLRERAQQRAEHDFAWYSKPPGPAA